VHGTPVTGSQGVTAAEASPILEGIKKTKRNKNIEKAKNIFFIPFQLSTTCIMKKDRCILN